MSININVTIPSQHVLNQNNFLKKLSYFTIFCANIMARKKYKDRKIWQTHKRKTILVNCGGGDNQVIKYGVSSLHSEFLQW